MTEAAFEVNAVSSRYKSPWPFRERITLFLWTIAWPLLCGWTPKPFNAWRLIWLRIFGCKINGKPFVHQRARIQIPWHVSLHDRSCVGDRANLYSLGEIELGSKCVIAQEAYLCTGTHDFNDRNMSLVTAKIIVATNAFIGARAFIMPGVRIGEGAVVGACSVVTGDLPPWTVSAGNPSRVIKRRGELHAGTSALQSWGRK
jgi:putative colanic acid biosynthesis acetyltransferase WcaF